MAGYWWKSNMSKGGRAAFVAHTDFYNHSMLHQTFTPPPFLHFPFHHRHTPAPAPATQPPPAARSAQGEKVMEGAEVAELRRARRPERAPAPAPAPAAAPPQLQQAPVAGEETAWVGDRGGFLGDDFSIDDLLDFGGLETEMVEEPDEGEPNNDKGDGEPNNEKGDAFAPDTKSTPVAGAAFLAPAVAAVPPPPPVSDIDLPAHDAAEFEWMTSLMEDDSLPAYPGVAPYRPATQTKAPAKTHPHEPKPEPVWLVDAPPSQEDIRLSVDDLAPVKAKRSKRRRTPGHAWPAATSTSSSSSSSSSSPTSSYLAFYSSSAYPFEPSRPKPKKRGRKPKKHYSEGGHGGASGAPGDRRCTHCGAQKTPQWRAGPSGPKTLCNACGVRFKSGRLVPEYRPAASPTFISHVHSNSHRKVLEMRRKKDEQLLAPPVAS